MKKILVATVFALMLTALPASARVNSFIPIPSAQNSGAGIPGLAGDEDGSAVKPGTVINATSAIKYDPTVLEQDASLIPGLPGTESGPAVKPAAHIPLID
jgi:hypothetical protein